MKKAFTLIEVMIVVLIVGILLAIALPNFQRARMKARYTQCIANLTQIQAAKEQWAMDSRKTANDTPVATDLYGAGLYVTVEPTCPADGTYALNSIAANPTCTIGGVWPHQIP